MDRDSLLLDAAAAVTDPRAGRNWRCRRRGLRGKEHLLRVRLGQLLRNSAEGTNGVAGEPQWNQLGKPLGAR